MASRRRGHLNKKVNDKKMNGQAEKQCKGSGGKYKLGLFQKQNVMWLKHNEQCGQRGRQGQVAGA